MSSQILSTDIDVSNFSQSNLDALRTRFPDVNDTALARFLLARSNDLEKASDMLGNMLKWRASNGPVLKSQCLAELSTGKLYIHGMDKEGHPLLVFRTCCNIASERDLEEAGLLIRYMVDLLIQRMPPDKSKYSILIDRSNHKSENTDLELTKHLAKALQDNYPERLHTCVLYPSDFIFYSVWNIAKWFLDPVTRGKVNPCMRFSGLTYYIDPEFIPVEVGGQSTYSFNIDDYPEQSFEVIVETGKPWVASAAGADGEAATAACSTPDATTTDDA